MACDSLSVSLPLALCCQHRLEKVPLLPFNIAMGINSDCVLHDALCDARYRDEIDCDVESHVDRHINWDNHEKVPSMWDADDGGHDHLSNIRAA